MGKAMTLTAGFVTAPSTTFTAWTLLAGSSLTVQNSVPGKAIEIISIWAQNQGAGELRIRSSKLHDQVDGIRMAVPVLDPTPLFPMGWKQPLFPQDTLVAEHTGSATAGDIEHGAFLTYYEDQPGADARLITSEDVRRYGVNLAGVTNTLTTGTAGAYSTDETIVAERDNLKANSDYALVGYRVSLPVAIVSWIGPDTANLRVGGPGVGTAGVITADWFMKLSDASGRPCIPVINAANKNSTYINCATNELGVDPIVTTYLVELAPGVVNALGQRR